MSNLKDLIERLEKVVYTAENFYSVEYVDSLRDEIKHLQNALDYAKKERDYERAAYGKRMRVAAYVTYDTHAAPASAPKEPAPSPSPACSTCNDTHKMTLHTSSGDTREVMCTRCPRPCQRCRQGGNGAYCEMTPCACACHKTAAGVAAPSPPPYEADALIWADGDWICLDDERLAMCPVRSSRDIIVRDARKLARRVLARVRAEARAAALEEAAKDRRTTIALIHEEFSNTPDTLYREGKIELRARLCSRIRALSKESPNGE